MMQSSAAALSTAPVSLPLAFHRDLDGTREGYKCSSDIVEPSLCSVHSPMPRVSRLSANGKGNNKVKSRSLHISHGIYLTAEKNPRF